MAVDGNVNFRCSFMKKYFFYKHNMEESGKKLAPNISRSTVMLASTVNACLEDYGKPDATE